MADAKRTFPTGGRVSPEDLVDREAILGELFARTFDHGNRPRQLGAPTGASPDRQDERGR